MFKLGDKIVPVGDGVYVPLIDSLAWKRAVDRNQNFLYVNYIDDEGVLICGDRSSEEYFTDGSNFKQENVILYKEPKNTQISYDITGEEVIRLVSLGVIKESDLFLLKRVE